jgi:TonB-linked SusC/RagA family outer membrane protein
MRRFLSLFTMLMLCGVLAFAQSRVVSGKVTDKDGNAVPFATVQIKGTKNGIASDANGSYSLRIKDGDVLSITAAGYTKIEILVGQQTYITSVMERATNVELESVVVTAVGIRRQAKSLGYSTATVGSEELTKARVTNVATGLAAKVSGLQVNLINSGVKSETRVTLRGNRSILGNNQALLVVDNIQLPISYLSSLSPNDIENVSILKGASASALYGSAASNGVIILTTKKGTSGKPQIKVSSTVAFEEISYMPALQNEFGTFGGEAPASAFPGTFYLPGNPYVPYVPYENQNYGPRFNGQMVPIGAPIRVFYSDGTYAIKQDSVRYSAVPNAKKGFFDKGLTLINNLSYSTGDAKSRFYMSFEDVNIKGIIPKDVNRRNTIRINGSRESGIFRADYNIGYTLNHSNTTPGTGVPFTWGTTGYTGGYAGGGSYFQNRPVYWTLLNSPAFVDLRNYKNWQDNPFANPDGYFNAYYGNPWWQIDQTRLDEKSNDLIASLKLSFKVAPWLDIQYSGAIARDDYSNKYTQAGYTFAPWAIADTLGAGNIPNGVKKLSPSQGDALSYNQRLSSDLLASVHRSAGKFDFKFIAGTSLIVNNTRLLSTSASALVIPDFYNVSNRLGIAAVSEYKEETRLLGVFGDLTIGFNNYFFLHGSIRNDQNSLLSEANRSYNYPAVDAAFVLTDAIPALKSNRLLNFAKIRAAWSQTAQVSIGAYALSNSFGVGPGFPFGSNAGFSVGNTFANPDIKPEISTDKEIGIELGFFKDRLHIGAAYYSTSTSNQTIPISISPTTGFTSALVNSGVMSNKGVELDLKVIPVQTKNIKWDVGINYSNNKNVLESLGYGLSSIPVTNPANSSGIGTGSANGNSFAIVGSPYPYLKTSDWNRDPQGRIIIDPLNGNPTANPTPQGFGTTNPPVKIGINSSVTYKNITLSATVDGRFGAVIFNQVGSTLDFTGVSAYSASFGRQPFVIPNSSYFDATKNTYLPNTSYNTKDGNLAFWAGTWSSVGSNYVTSADFWKLREFSLSYNIPAKILASQKMIKAVSFGITGRNLFVKKAKSNLWSDPEFANNSGNGTGTTDINQVPPTKFIGFNFSLTF